MENTAKRDLNQEYKDASDRKYAYDFDWVTRKYLLKAVAPYFKPGARALELGCYKGDMTEQILGYFERLTVVEGASEGPGSDCGYPGVAHLPVGSRASCTSTPDSSPRNLNDCRTMLARVSGR